MRHGNDPGSLGTVNRSQILLEPLNLLIRGIVGPGVVDDVAEWATVRNLKEVRIMSNSKQ